MKKIIVLCSLIIALGFVTTGCGGGDTASTPSTPPATGDHDGHDHGGDPAPVEEAAE